jgi:hypothetical protein
MDQQPIEPRIKSQDKNVKSSVLILGS